MPAIIGAYTVVAAVGGSIVGGIFSMSAASKQARAAERTRQAEERRANRQRIDWLNQQKLDEWNLEIDRGINQYNSRVSQELSGATLGAQYGFPGRTYGGQVVTPAPIPAKPKPIPNPYL